MELTNYSECVYRLVHTRYVTKYISMEVYQNWFHSTHKWAYNILMLSILSTKAAHMHDNYPNNDNAFNFTVLTFYSMRNGARYVFMRSAQRVTAQMEPQHEFRCFRVETARESVTPEFKLHSFILPWTKSKD
jgi:hypothetical protein